MKHVSHYFLGSALLLGLSNSAFADYINWTDWHSSADAYSVSGVIDRGAPEDDIYVEYLATNPYHFVQFGQGDGVGTYVDMNYWRESDNLPAYIGHRPPPTEYEMIALNEGGEVTISFFDSLGQPLTVADPHVAINSWDDNVVEFYKADLTPIPITFESIGEGNGEGLLWGSGSYTLNGVGNGFTGNDELHALIRLDGEFDSFNFSHTDENWHGVTTGQTHLNLHENTTLARNASFNAAFCILRGTLRLLPSRSNKPKHKCRKEVIMAGALFFRMRLLSSFIETSKRQCS